MRIKGTADKDKKEGTRTRGVQLREEELKLQQQQQQEEEEQQQENQEQTILIDSFGRIAKKLRISVTDRCNMQCMYCMPPQSKVQWFNKENVLDYDEIARLVSILADLGIERIRLTGGEPLLRPKLEDLIISLGNINGIKSISMTTNGLLLGNKVKQLRDAGLEGVNISLDSFRANRFKAITGTGSLDKVIDAIEAADRVGLKVKINTVVIRGWNEDEIVDFANFARNTGHTVRFIEFMPLDGSGIWQPDLVYSKKEMIESIIRNIGKIMPLNDNYGGSTNSNIYSSDPATPYSFVDGKGTIGFIPSITEPFCGNCDRVRLTSDGRLLTCLFEKSGYDLRGMLRSRKSDYIIKKQLIEDIRKKPEGIIKMIKTKALKPSLNLMHTIGG
jgi:cyclic pyranopterin phosphate synthase